MSGLKVVALQLVTALATFGAVMIWVDRRDARRDAVAAARPPQPLVIPGEVLKAGDVDEQINIRVYAGTNRGVVNITTSASTVGMFGDESTTSGSGSGFVIDRDGHILTNYHVIEGADSVQVTLSDGSTHEALVVGADASNDLAVLKVEIPAEGLSPVVLGDSSGLLVGQKVLALGNPFGLERTLTTGIISSLDRSIKAKNGRTIKGIIQTDAAINPGNSGGPLLNSRGEVIGMNTAILSQVGQSAGISFSVPINAIKRILRPLIDDGKVVRADLGLTRVYRTQDGLLILGVVKGGAAEASGLRPIQLRRSRFGNVAVVPDSADLIVAIDRKPVKSYEDLLTEVEAHTPGEEVVVTVIRQGKKVEMPVKLGRS